MKNKDTAVIFDLDSTLCHTQHRWHLAPSADSAKTWDAYAAACAGDSPLPGTLARMNLDWKHHQVHVCSGRSGSALERTEDWLFDHGAVCDFIRLRAADDFRPNEVIKVDYVREVRRSGVEVVLFYEDWAAGRPCYLGADRRPGARRESVLRRGSDEDRCAAGSAGRHGRRAVSESEPPLLKLSWSRLRLHAECQRKGALIAAGMKSPIADVRVFFRGNVVDQAMRHWLEQDDPQPGWMAAHVDEMFEQAEKNAAEEGVIKWRGSSDKSQVRVWCRELVTRLEPILAKLALPYGYQPASRFEVPLTIPGPDGAPARLRCAGRLT